MSARAFFFALIPALLLPFLTSACGGSAKKEEAVEVVKIDPPELVLRNFYTALDKDDRATAETLLSQRAKLTDPKGGSLLSNTVSQIQTNEGIAKFDVLKVGAEIIEIEHSEDGPGEEKRTVTVEFEIKFKNGDTRRSTSQLIYEQLPTPEDAEEDEPAEFGWRVEGVRAVIGQEG